MDRGVWQRLQLYRGYRDAVRAVHGRRSGWLERRRLREAEHRRWVPAIPLQRAGFPNALGTPALVDRDLNGTVDLAYAGDLLGNLYRFDLSNPNPNNWTVTKLFTATYSDGTLQPITKQPVVVKHPTQPGFMVIFGTGSYIAKDDARDQNIQSVYGIWDRLDNVPATAAPIRAHNGSCSRS